VFNVTGLLKRLVIGRARRSEELQGDAAAQTARPADLRQRPAVVGGVRDAGDPARAHPGRAGVPALTPWIALAVVSLLTVVVLSYRQVVLRLPERRRLVRGGLHEPRPVGRLVVAAALLVDYVMTVAVSVAAGVDNIISAIPAN
jgi:hypothetical protein